MLSPTIPSRIIISQRSIQDRFRSCTHCYIATINCPGKIVLIHKSTTTKGKGNASNSNHKSIHSIKVHPFSSKIRKRSQSNKPRKKNEGNNFYLIYFPNKYKNTFSYIILVSDLETNVDHIEFHLHFWFPFVHCLY